MQKIKLSDIKISEAFKNTPPVERKVERVRRKYLQDGVQDKPVVINENGYLVDGYIRYLVLQECGVEYVNYICIKK